MNCQTALFSSFAGLATHSPTKAEMREAEQTPNTEQLLPLYQQACLLGLSSGSEGTPGFFLWPLPTLQCTLQAAFLQPASNRKGKGPCPAVISPGQRLLSPGVRLVPPDSSATHLSRGAFGVFLLNISRKGKYPAGRELPYFWDTNRSWGFKPQNSSPHQIFQALFKTGADKVRNVFIHLRNTA